MSRGKSGREGLYQSPVQLDKVEKSKRKGGGEVGVGRGCHHTKQSRSKSGCQLLVIT